MTYDKILRTVNDKSAAIGVIGLGYVGLPLALTFASKGFLVTGFDVDPLKIDLLARGQSYISHIESENIRNHVSEGNLKPTTEFSELVKMTVIIICVPTPLNKEREPVLTFIETTTKKISETLHIGQVVVLESTTYPGCCQEIVKPILQNSGLSTNLEVPVPPRPSNRDRYILWKKSHLVITNLIL